MAILEVGAGTGGATKAIFNEIGSTFSTYTYTDISTGFMEKAQETFRTMADKMVFRALNIEKDIVEQGYHEHSYDLIVGSLVLHATKDLKKTMQETRRLLKPGDYLVINEITDTDGLRVGFAMSGLPGWWLGREDGRRYTPCVNSARWHQLLLDTGFSGIDTITPEVDTLPRPFSVIVSQAVDQRVSVIREPLLFPDGCGAAAADDGDLVIIGGQTLTTVVLIGRVLELTNASGFRVTRFSSLEDIDDPVAIPPRALVLMLAELDHLVFEHLTRAALKGIQAVVDYQRTILWITQGCRAEQPCMNMSVGLGRTLALEVPAVRMQFLDLNVARKPNARLVAETLLRLRFTREAASTDGMLFSAELELAEEGERVLIPRLLPSRRPNERYNSTKRCVTRDQGAHEGPLVLAVTDSGYAVHEAATDHIAPGEVLVHVTASTLTPIAEDMYGVFGRDRNTNTWVLGLSRTNGSCVAVRREHLLCVGGGGGTEDGACSDADREQLLGLLAIEAQCRQILLATSHEGTLVVHEPPTPLASRLLELAGEGTTKVLITTSSPPAYQKLHVPDHCSVLALAPSAPKRDVRVALPPDVSLFVDCSTEPRHVGLASVIVSSLPPSAWSTTLVELRAQHRLRSDPAVNLSDLLQQAVVRRQRGVEAAGGLQAALTLKTLVTKPGTELPVTASPTLVSWDDADKVPVTVRSVDTIISFHADKTYVLFGLSGDLGRCLVEWMDSHGARNVVLTSRHPDVDPRWLQECRTNNMRVEVYAK